MKDEIIEEVWKSKQEVSEEYKGDIKLFVESIKKQAANIRKQIEEISVNADQEKRAQAHR